MKKTMTLMLTVTTIFSTLPVFATPMNNSGYVMIEKDLSGTFPVQNCQINELQARIECRPVAQLTGEQIKSIENQILQTIHTQNLKTGVLVVGGVVVGVVVGAVGGILVLGTSAGLAAATSLGFVGFEGAGAGVILGLVGGGAVGGVAGGVGTKSVSSVIFDDHESYKMLFAQFSKLLSSGEPIIIHDANPASQSIKDLLATAAGANSISNLKP